jgi:hypothetical protein
MANLIDNTYFIREISLPSKWLETGGLIESYIPMYEAQVLTELLGYTEYKSLKTEIEAGSYSSKWKNFVEGVEYEVEYNGVTQTVNWNGLINAEKISFIAYYIYYFIIKDHITKTDSLGELLSLSENATRINPADKMAYSWNRYTELYGCTGDTVVTPSAYRYLKENEDTYPAWIFTKTARINSFGI